MDGAERALFQGQGRQQQFSRMEEFDKTQFVAAQPFHEGPERGHGQIVMVDDQSGREAWKIGETQSGLHGNE